MKILILDDDQERHRVFAGYFRGRGDVTHVVNFSEFSRQFVRKGPWDLVLLDYDLNLCQPEETVNVDGDEVTATGEHAAMLIAMPWLSGLKGAMKRRPPTVIVHSMNETGTKRILRVLENAGITAHRHRYREDGLEAWLAH